MLFKHYLLAYRWNNLIHETLQIIKNSKQDQSAPKWYTDTHYSLIPVRYIKITKDLLTHSP